MEINYGSRGINNYIESEINKDITEISSKKYMFDMLENNDIDGIIRPVINMIDNNVYLRYPINSCFVLKKYFQKNKPDIMCLEKIIRGICNSIKDMEKYLLCPDDLVISPEYMLWDDNEKKIKMICIPLYNRDIRSQLKKFMEYVMRIFDYKSAEGIIKMHDIYEVTVKENFDLSELDDFFSKRDFDHVSNREPMKILPSEEECINNEAEREKQEETEIEAKIIGQSHTHENILTINLILAIVFMLGYMFTNKGKAMLVLFIISLIMLVIDFVLYYLKKEKEEEIDADEYMKEFEQKIFETKISDTNGGFSAGETAYHKPKLSRKFEPDIKVKEEYKLVPLNDGMLEPIVIDTKKEELVIGRGKNNTDYRLDKEQISRVHARILIRNNNIFIEDKNSTNGTFVNSVKLKANEEFKVKAGDIVRLANEEFFVA